MKCISINTSFITCLHFLGHPVCLKNEHSHVVSLPGTKLELLRNALFSQKGDDRLQRRREDRTRNATRPDPTGGRGGLEAACGRNTARIPGRPGPFPFTPRRESRRTGGKGKRASTGGEVPPSEGKARKKSCSLRRSPSARHLEAQKPRSQRRTRRGTFARTCREPGSAMGRDPVTTAAAPAPHGEPGLGRRRAGPAVSPRPRAPPHARALPHPSGPRRPEPRAPCETPHTPRPARRSLSPELRR